MWTMSQRPEHITGKVWLCREKMDIQDNWLVCCVLTSSVQRVEGIAANVASYHTRVAIARRRH